MDEIDLPPDLIEALRKYNARTGVAEDPLYSIERRERALMAERTEIEAAEARGFARGYARALARAEEHGAVSSAMQIKEDALLRLIQGGMAEAQARTILKM